MTHELYIKRAIEAFSQHKILARDPADPPSWWRIGKPGCSEYWAVIFGHARHLIVQGDIDMCAFAYGPDGPPRNLISWIGRDRFDSYTCEKATIGTNERNLIWERDQDETIRDLKERLEAPDQWPEHKVEGYTGAVRDTISEIRGGGDVDTELMELYRIGALDSDDGDIGEIPTTRVIYAWAAVHRLNELLMIEEKPT